MSDVESGTPSGEEGPYESVTQPPTQRLEEGRCDLPPDESLSPRPERFRSSNVIGNWEPVSRDEAREESSDDSGHGDDYKSNLDTDQDDPSASSPRSQRTGTNRGGAGDETPLKTIGTTKPQQQSLGPAGREGNDSGSAQARDKNNALQPHLRLAGTQGNASMFAQARDKNNTQQQILGPAGTQGTTSMFAQARDKNNTKQQSVGPAGTQGTTSMFAQARDKSNTQQQSSGPAGTQGTTSMFAQARNKNNTQQQSVGPAGTQGTTSMFAQARDKNNTQQQSWGPAGTEGTTSMFAQARNQNYTQQPHLGPAGMRRECEKKCPTGVTSGQRTVDPERNPTQKNPIQADVTQTQKQELKGEMSKRCDQRVGASPKRLTVAENIQRSKAGNLSQIQNRDTDRVATTAPMQMSPVVGESAEPLGQVQAPSATAVIRPSGAVERNTSVKQSEGAPERLETPMEAGPTPADSEEVHRDTDVTCTTSVGYLLDPTEGGRNNTIKERIMFEMSQYPVSRQQSAYGLGAQFLGYEDWKLEKMWDAQVPGCDAKMERVKNILQALKAEGKTMNHILLYFIQQDSRRLDIVKLIMEIHQCECCKKIFKNVNM